MVILRVADEVMRRPEPDVERQSDLEEPINQKEELLKTKEQSNQALDVGPDLASSIADIQFFACVA